MILCNAIFMVKGRNKIDATDLYLMSNDVAKKIWGLSGFISHFTDAPVALSSLQKEQKMPLKQRKVAVMGSRSVGKSSLVIQFVQVTMIN